jgi:hypothetical protein
MTRHIPNRHSAAYAAGALIYQEGSKPEADLFARVDYGHAPNRRKINLERDIESGWLRRVAGNRIALTDWALTYYENEPAAEEPKFVGRPAAPRQVDVMQRPPISKRFIPNPRGQRDDVPAWSVRETAHFHKG